MNIVSFKKALHLVLLANCLRQYCCCFVAHDKHSCSSYYFLH